MLIMMACLWCAPTPLILRFEEPVLREKFGDDYLDHCRHVRRWIPRLTPFDNTRRAAVTSSLLD